MPTPTCRTWFLERERVLVGSVPGANDLLTVLTPEEAIVRSVNAGGDADTLGAMTGAMAGACHGLSRLPERWVDALEDGEKGRG